MSDPTIAEMKRRLWDWQCAGCGADLMARPPADPAHDVVGVCSVPCLEVRNRVFEQAKQEQAAAKAAAKGA